jgi:hypothetical protein
MLEVELGGQPVHVVLSQDVKNQTCYVVTAYVPNLGLWHDDFRTRR